LKFDKYLLKDIHRKDKKNDKSFNKERPR